jgi:hypothetical protein
MPCTEEYSFVSAVSEGRAEPAILARHQTEYVQRQRDGASSIPCRLFIPTTQARMKEKRKEEERKTHEKHTLQRNLSSWHAWYTSRSRRMLQAPTFRCDEDVRFTLGRSSRAPPPRGRPARRRLRRAGHSRRTRAGTRPATTRRCGGASPRRWRGGGWRGTGTAAGPPSLCWTTTALFLSLRATALKSAVWAWRYSRGG